MGEGELKKRIIDIAYGGEKRPYAFSVLLSQYDVVNILDAAKKEFPLDRKIKKIGNKEYRLIHEKFSTENEDEFAVIEQCMHWYEKWFGDEK